MALPQSGVSLVAQNASSFFSTMDKSNAALAGFGKTAVSSAGAVSSFGQAASTIKLDALANQLADQKARLGLLNQQLDVTKAKYGESSLQAQSKALAIGRLNDQISINERKYGDLAEKINAEAAAAQQSISPNDQLREAISKAAKEAAEAGPKFNSFSEIAIGGLRRLGEVGVNALGTLGQGIAGFAQASIGAAGDFEASLNGFSAVTGTALAESGYNLDQFKQKFLDLGASTQFSAQQAADAANALAKGGVPIKDIMGDATEATLGLAAAGGIELAPAAEIVAKQLGVWGDEGVTATNVSDRLAQAANASTVDVADLALGLANVGGAAREAGFTFDETVIAIGAISPAFSSASTAGTALNNFIARIQPSTKPAIEAMTELGLYSAATGSVFYDQQGNFVGLEKASGLLGDALNGLSEAERSAAVQTIFGNDAKIAALELARLNTDGISDFASAMDKQGSSASQAEKLNQGFNFAMESLGGSVENLQIALGDKFLPALTSVITNGLIPAVNAVGNFVTGLRPLGEIVGSVAGVLGDVLVPAVAGGTFAFVAFKVAALGGVIPALSTAGIALALAGSQFVGAAIAAGKATLAFAATAIAVAGIAVPIAAIVAAFNIFNDRLEEQNKAFLESRPAIQGAKDALNEYAAASQAIQENEAIKKEKENLEALQQQYESLIGRATGSGGLVDSWKAFWDTDEVTGKQIEQLKALEGQIATSSSKLSELTGAAQAAQSANMELAISEDAAMMGMVGLGDAATTTGEQFAASDEIIKDSLETMQKVRDDGVGVFDSITQSRTDFQANLERLKTEHEAKMAELNTTGNVEAIAAEQQSYADQQAVAVASYQEQQAAQRAHLGQMLIDYINAQAAINPAFREASGQLIGAISEEYGVQATLSQQLFGSMLDDIDTYATDGSGDIDGLIGKLRENEQNATDTQQAMDALAKDYNAQLISNFDDEKISADELTRAIDMFPAIKNTDLINNFLAGKIDAQALLAEINKLPSQKTINVHTSYTSSGTPPVGKGGATAMATGGPVAKGQPYLVGDGPGGRIGPWTEMFVPATSGRILNAGEVQALIRNGDNTPARAAWNAAPVGGVGAFSGAERAVAGSMNSLGKSMGGGFIAGIQTKLPAILDAGKTLSGSFVNGINEQVGKARPALASSLGSIFTGATTRPGAAFGSATRQAPISAAQLSAGTVVSNVTTKQYNLSLQQQQSTGSVMRDFRMMEALSIG